MDVLYNFLVRPILTPSMVGVKDGIRKVFKKQKSKEFDEKEQHDQTDLLVSACNNKNADETALTEKENSKGSQTSEEEIHHIDFEA